MNFGNQSADVEIHDNQRHGLQKKPSTPAALTAGRSVSKRHGKACMKHGIQSGTSTNKPTTVISEKQRIMSTKGA